jgi:hypothetical protein
LRRTLLHQLGQKFGEVPPEVATAVKSMKNVQQLEGWLERVVLARTLDAVGISTTD